MQRHLEEPPNGEQEMLRQYLSIRNFESGECSSRESKEMSERFKNTLLNYHSTLSQLQRCLNSTRNKSVFETGEGFAAGGGDRDERVNRMLEEHRLKKQIEVEEETEMLHSPRKPLTAIQRFYPNSTQMTVTNQSIATCSSNKNAFLTNEGGEAFFTNVYGSNEPPFSNIYGSNEDNQTVSSNAFVTNEGNQPLFSNTFSQVESPPNAEGLNSQKNFFSNDEFNEGELAILLKRGNIEAETKQGMEIEGNNMPESQDELNQPENRSRLTSLINNNNNSSSQIERDNSRENLLLKNLSRLHELYNNQDTGLEYEQISARMDELSKIEGGITADIGKIKRRDSSLNSNFVRGQLTNVEETRLHSRQNSLWLQQMSNDSSAITRQERDERSKSRHTREEQIEKLVMEKREAEVRELRSTPEISKRSSHLAQNSSRCRQNPDVVERLLNDKIEKEHRLKEQKENHNSNAAYDFKPKISESSEALRRSVNDLYQWERRVKNERESELIKKMREDEKESYELANKRKISQNSEKILEEKGRISSSNNNIINYSQAPVRREIPIFQVSECATAENQATQEIEDIMSSERKFIEQAYCNKNLRRNHSSGEISATGNEKISEKLTNETQNGPNHRQSKSQGNIKEEEQENLGKLYNRVSEQSLLKSLEERRQESQVVVSVNEQQINETIKENEDVLHRYYVELKGNHEESVNGARKTEHMLTSKHPIYERHELWRATVQYKLDQRRNAEQVEEVKSCTFTPSVSKNTHSKSRISCHAEEISAVALSYRDLNIEKENSGCKVSVKKATTTINEAASGSYSEQYKQRKESKSEEQLCAQKLVFR